MEITAREATKADLPAVLAIYGQPELDAGKLLSLEEAEKIYSRFQEYPFYRLYVAVAGQKIVGTFALLIMHNFDVNSRTISEGKSKRIGRAESSEANEPEYASSLSFTIKMPGTVNKTARYPFCSGNARTSGAIEITTVDVARMVRNHIA